MLCHNAEVNSIVNLQAGLDCIIDKLTYLRLKYTVNIEEMPANWKLTSLKETRMYYLPIDICLDL